MAKRTIGAERLFSLGDYKNLRLTESLEFDDEGYTDVDLDAMRLINIYNLYMGFAIHQRVLQDVKGVGFDPEEVIDLVLSEREDLKNTLVTLVEEDKDE